MRIRNATGWVFRPACQCFEHYAERWDAINRKGSHHILLDSIFVSALIRCFGSADILLGIAEDEARPGLILVQKVRKSLWQTFQPSQSPLGLMLLSNPAHTLGQMSQLMRCLPGCALGLSILQQDPDFTPFSNVGEFEDAHAEVLPYMRTPRLRLTGTFEDYWEERKNVLEAQHHLLQRQRRLVKQGIALALVQYRDAPSMAACVREHGRLEETGWKGTAGTALTDKNQQGRFYQEVLERFCANKEGVVYQLLFNKHIVASELAIERDGMLVLLKTAYDEQFRSCAPGFLMRLEILKSLFLEQRIRVVEFYGRQCDWHATWAAESRTMYHVNFYRHALIPTVRSILKCAAHLITLP